MQNVRIRKDKVHKAQFKERHDHDFKPFGLVGEVGRMEKWAWDSNSSTKSYGASSLRDRFQLLMTLGGVLRSESLYKADLSDLCDFKFHQKTERDPYHVCILRVSTGKTNADKVLYGRVMRHVDAQLCPIGALAMYLLIRFEVTKEHESIDFEDN